MLTTPRLPRPGGQRALVGLAHLVERGRHVTVHHNAISTSFLFPVTLQSGMLFDNVHDILVFVNKEAIERGLPVRMYNHYEHGKQVRLACKLCNSVLNFRRREDHWAATTSNHEHDHSKTHS